MAAPSRRCASRAPSISTAFFTALSSAIGSGPFADLAAGAGDRSAPAHRRRSRGRGARSCRPCRAPTSAPAKSPGCAHIGKLLEPMAHVVRELAAVDEQRRAALARDDGEGERQRRVRDIGAADVEGPGDRVRIGDDQRVGLELGDLGPDGRELGLGGLAGKTHVVQRHRAERRGRAVLPQLVDRIGVDRDQRGAGIGAGASRASPRLRRCAATDRSRARRSC